jgi:hypothetical protein
MTEHELRQSERNEKSKLSLPPGTHASGVLFPRPPARARQRRAHRAEVSTGSDSDRVLVRQDR